MKDNMDGGGVELSDHVMLSNPDSSSNFQDSTSGDSFLDEFLKNARTCTHTHTCNPPGPDSVHTHTCYHTHTQVIASLDDNHLNGKDHSSLKPRRPLGNREAVRKYREKKKAHTAYLEEEVKKLHLLNQQLAKRLQGQAALEAEVLWLRTLLVDLRAKIDGKLGAFPFQKQCNTTTTTFKEGDSASQPTGAPVGQHCLTDLPCFHPQAGLSLRSNVGGSKEMMVYWEGNCQAATINCHANRNEMASADGHTVHAVEALLSPTSQAK